MKVSGSLLRFYLFCVIVICSFQSSISFERPGRASAKPSSRSPLKSSSRWDRYLEKIFEEADTNHDGSISFEEVYERVLLFYIKLNQKAPIPPPSKQRVRSLYQAADWSHNRRLDSSEFQALAGTLAARGYVRLVAHKIVTVVVAPILANHVVNVLANADRLEGLRESYANFVTQHVPPKYVDTVLSVEFWKTLITILAVAQLGNLVLDVVNWVLDLRKPILLESNGTREKNTKTK